MQMGKVREHGHLHHGYPHHQYHHQSKTQKPKAMKKSVKITYISSPLTVKACDASEFRAIVQQLTGKDSNNNETTHHVHDDPNYKEPPICRVMQEDGALCAISATNAMVTELDGNSGSSCYNGSTSMDSFEFWQQVLV